MTLQRQVRRQQSAVSRERVIESIGDQAVRVDNSRGLAIEGWMNRRGILDWVQMSLFFRGLAYPLILRSRNSLDPSHKVVVVVRQLKLGNVGEADLTEPSAVAPDAKVNFGVDELAKAVSVERML